MIVVACFVLWSAAVAGQAPAGERDAGGLRAPTPALERGRSVYVLNTCHFCHGVDLTGATMGAADLLHSPLVGSDEHGDVIGAVARAGKPNLQTSMPAYPDLTAEEVKDLAGYIHYLRQLGRRTELIAGRGTSGDVKAGRDYFAANCAGCHSTSRDLRGVAHKYGGAELRARILGAAPPVPADATTAAIAAGRARHLTLLERYQDTDVDNLVAYLRQPR